MEAALSARNVVAGEPDLSLITRFLLEEIEAKGLRLMPGSSETEFFDGPRAKLPNLLTAVIYGFAGMGAVKYLTLLPALDAFRAEAGTAALAVPLLGFGAVLGWVFPLFPHAGPSTLFGSARWASKKEADALTRNNGGLLIGRQRKGSRLIRYDGISHLITLAPTRTGKGVGTIIPNLLDLDRSILCIDPKGENARITARARSRFGPVFVLDPFDASGSPSAAYNPMNALNPFSLDMAEDAATLAEALVIDPPGQVAEAHWKRGSESAACRHHPVRRLRGGAAPAHPRHRARAHHRSAG